MDDLVLALSGSDKGSLPLVGGKGANLGELLRAGFHVPPGFCVTTRAYEAFTAQSPELADLLSRLTHMRDADEARALATCVRSRMLALTMPDAVRAAVLAAWRRLGPEKAYAVRSSGVAEDLEAASFAGQQDTYLNVRGEAALLDAVRRCFASLFTERAVSYRLKRGFGIDAPALAAVVQEMVRADVSGVMFTADPVSQNRAVVSIDASFGLGEALVSGIVTPDLYRVRDGEIVEKTIAKKTVAIHATEGGGTRTVSLSHEIQSAPALTDGEILTLARLGKEIEQHYGRPQDIEWCRAQGTFAIVQSRPITTLYPLPALAGRRRLLMSLGHIQMMTEPMTPLALSVFKALFSGVYEAGGRAYVDVAPILGMGPLRHIVPRILRHMDEELAAAMLEAMGRSDVEIGHTRLPLGKMAPLARTAIGIVLRSMTRKDPARARVAAMRAIEASVADCRRRVLGVRGPRRIDAIYEDLRVLPRDLAGVVPYWITSVFAWILIGKWLRRWLGESEIPAALQRSLAGNVTSEMGLVVGDLADIVRPRPSLLAYLRESSDVGFWDGLATLDDGGEFQRAFAAFMERYGMRCAGEIDIGRPRWRDTPSALAAAILGHVRTVQPGAHRENFRQGARDAESAAQSLVRRVRARKGALKAHALAHMIAVYRELGGLREHHKYLVVQHLGIYRQAILQQAQELVRYGVFKQESDAFSLHLDELRALLADATSMDVAALIEKRRREQERYGALTPPRLMTGEGEILGARRPESALPAGTFVGTPVSPGIATGVARVVMQPERAHLQPGEILVAPFTDPGWTPLFQSAKALVMEVGGLMTHGAVIVREYGIPAVAGVDGATRKILDGALVEVDGTRGTVRICGAQTEE